MSKKGNVVVVVVVVIVVVVVVAILRYLGLCRTSLLCPPVLNSHLRGTMHSQIKEAVKTAHCKKHTIGDQQVFRFFLLNVELANLALFSAKYCHTENTLKSKTFD